MNIPILPFLAAVLFGIPSPGHGEIPEGSGQLTTVPAFFPGGRDSEGRAYQHLGQSAQNGKLILTAGNGFFDHGTCIAQGESRLPKVGDEILIQPNFEALRNWKSRDGELRWHLWIEKPGSVIFRLNLEVPEGSEGSRIAVTFAGKNKELNTVVGMRQDEKITFEVHDPGAHVVALKAVEIADLKIGVGSLRTVDVFGPAIDSKAQILRARWRPAAVHGRYERGGLERSQMWVMTTRSEANTTSYSPITTPFGYYGTSFQADRRSNGQFNFSMWAASDQGKLPPLIEMPHLLASGSREAEFGGFGHEGSGVKIRSWTPMPDHPTEVIQALRVDNDGNYHRYSGYFWDHPTGRWKLFAVGRKWSGGKPMTFLSPGSFCEIPGPPHTERTGDIVREVRRRGWFMDETGNWLAMDRYAGSKKKVEWVNQELFVTKEGEFAMATGGLRFYEQRQPELVKAAPPLPLFLSKENTAQLFNLPATFGTHEITQTTPEKVTLKFEMKDAGVHASAVVYYGKTDALTFARRELHGTEKKSEISQSTQAEDRSWELESSVSQVKNGWSQVTLEGLEPGQKYFYRILVTNDAGKIWTFETRSFETRSL